MELEQQQLIFRKALNTETDIVWEILQQAIARRKSDGSRQWQDGYPNPETVKSDMKNGYGYVLSINNEIAAYCALLFDIEPAYEEISGKWLSDGTYAVVHRVAVADQFAGRNLGNEIFVQIEKSVRSKGLTSIKVDTNFDNIPMLKILDRLGYHYCGKVYFRGVERLAYEKVLN